jgi:flagellar basal body-associated protein FliL
MAFCNSCGAPLTAGTKFCNKCGAAVAGSVASASPTAPAPVTPAPTRGGSSALKIVLIVIVVILVLGIIGVTAVSIIGYRIAKGTRVRQNGDNVNVVTPFGSVQTTKDPDQAAKNLGIDLYPGAEVQKDGASSATFGSIHTVAANFQSSDSVDKVCNFYKERFPAAMVTSSDENHCSIVSNDSKNMVTINVEPSGSGSRFNITNVSKGK